MMSDVVLFTRLAPLVVWLAVVLALSTAGAVVAERALFAIREARAAASRRATCRSCDARSTATPTRKPPRRLPPPRSPRDRDPARRAADRGPRSRADRADTGDRGAMAMIPYADTLVTSRGGGAAPSGCAPSDAAGPGSHRVDRRRPRRLARRSPRRGARRADGLARSRLAAGVDPARLPNDAASRRRPSALTAFGSRAEPSCWNSPRPIRRAAPSTRLALAICGTEASRPVLLRLDGDSRAECAPRRSTPSRTSGSTPARAARHRRARRP